MLDLRIKIYSFTTAWCRYIYSHCYPVKCSLKFYSMRSLLRSLLSLRNPDGGGAKPRVRDRQQDQRVMLVRKELAESIPDPAPYLVHAPGRAAPVPEIDN
jgi:hypothetical protein